MSAAAASGPLRVFALLGLPEPDRVPAAEQDAVALRLQAALRASEALCPARRAEPRKDRRMVSEALLRPMRHSDLDGVIAFAVQAWAPVFESMRHVLAPPMFDRLYPDWRTQQAAAVRTTCTDPAMRVTVADVDGVAVGFVAFTADAPSRTGVIDMVAVDPAHQGSGVGSALVGHAFETLRDDGMRVAVVETGGDPGHAPARRVYERSGAVRMPIARYFKALEPAAGAEEEAR